MTIFDARKLESGIELTADICIVGAGAAGLTIASELDGTRKRVVLIESGGLQPDPDTQSLYDLESAGYPIREDFMSRARYYGGSCNLWAGRSMKLTASDLEVRPWVPHSGWPLPWAELSRYYPRAAEILGLPPIDLFEPGHHSGDLTDGERGLYAGEALVPAVSLWARRAKRFGSAYRRMLRRSRNVTLILYGNVTGVGLNDECTRVESVDVATLTGTVFRVEARAVVLACGGLENARLLLVSRDRHSAGVGNAWDTVGRYFMDHPRAVFGRVRLAEGAQLSLLDGRPLVDGKVQFGLGLSREAQHRHGLLDHYATLEAEHSDYAAKQYQSFIQTMKVLLRRGYAGSRWNVGRAEMGDIAGLVYLLTPRELMPHTVYRWYWRVRRSLARRRGSGRRVVVYFCEQPPDPDSRVILSRERDRLGLNRIVLRWNLSSAVRDSVRRLQEMIAERLKQTGLGVLEEGEGEVYFTDASHHMGTTRMSVAPRTGVVDPDTQVHGVRGLYIAGSSVFPSASHKNPTLTIVALALRLADRLREVSD